MTIILVIESGSCIFAMFQNLSISATSAPMVAILLDYVISGTSRPNTILQIYIYMNEPIFETMILGALVFNSKLIDMNNTMLLLRK